MFLANLVNMDERKAFCNLASAIINADAKQEVREVILMQNFIKEMIIGNDIALEDSVAFSDFLMKSIHKEKLSDSEIEKNIDIFVSADKLIKKTVLFELIALAYVDFDFDLNEKTLIDYIAQKFGFSDELIKEMLHLIVSMNNAVVTAEKLIRV